MFVHREFFTELMQHMDRIFVGPAHISEVHTYFRGVMDAATAEAERTSRAAEQYLHTADGIRNQPVLRPDAEDVIPMEGHERTGSDVTVRKSPSVASTPKESDTEVLSGNTKASSDSIVLPSSNSERSITRPFPKRDRSRYFYDLVARIMDQIGKGRGEAYLRTLRRIRIVGVSSAFRTI